MTVAAVGEQEENQMMEAQAEVKRRSIGLAATLLCRRDVQSSHAVAAGLQTTRVAATRCPNAPQKMAAPEVTAVLQGVSQTSGNCVLTVVVQAAAREESGLVDGDDAG